MLNAKLMSVCGVLAVCLAACTDAKHSDELVPSAATITIYSAGGSVVSGAVESSALGTRRLRLPSTAKAVNLSQNGETVPWFTVQTVQTAPEPKKTAEAGKKEEQLEEKYRLVGLPPLKSGELKFNYMLPEITWSPHLNATILDGKKVGLQLQADIKVGADVPFHNCAVTLVLNNSVSVEKLSGQTFNLTVTDLFPSRDIIYNLDNKTAEYSFVREWNTYVGSDEVRMLLQVNNPFTIGINGLGYSVESNKISIESGSVADGSRPGEPLFLGAGIDDSIYTFRSVKVTETPGKLPLPFNHKISYEMTNKSAEEKKLRVLAQRVMGTEHKSEYHFTSKQPDAIPEDAILWIFTLAPGAKQTLEFDYDADVKDVNGEGGFEQGM
ncbi:MAG: hypothetical protein QM723_17900 [Myxococcaceae bacterium]